MNFPNHIAFGLFSTNLALAASNSETTDDITSVAICLISSLLPDIDQPNSLIGRITTTLSAWIYSRYGHRTLTHSFLFLFSTSIVFFLLENFLLSNTRYSLIYTISILSHILLDMSTTEGVEFLFPFYKTRYVIFSDQKYQLKGGNKKHELILFISIIAFSIALMQFFKLGISKFARSQINTTKNIYEIFNESNEPIFVEYDLVQTGKPMKGIGIVIDADPRKLIIFNQEFITIDASTIINQLKQVQKNCSIEFIKESHKCLNQTQFIKLIKDKFIITCNIQSNYNMLYHSNNKLLKTKNLFIEYIHSPQIEIEENIEEVKKIEILKEIKKIEHKLAHSDIVEREMLSEDLIRLKKEYKTLESEEPISFDIEITYIKQ